MRKLRMRWTVVTLAAFGFLVISGASHASCTGSDRLSLSRANCLDGDHYSVCSFRLFGTCMVKKYKVWVQSRCSGDGTKVVAKIDIANVTDLTWHQTSNAKRSVETDNPINGVYCCDDLGQCN